MSDRPVLYVGHRVPFVGLEPEPFATFAYGALQHIGKKRGWTGFSRSDPGPDGGFDSEARTPDKRVVCIQCKRYKAALSIADTAKELAKVALNSAIDETDVCCFLLVTSGRLQQKLESALRETGRAKILEMALELATGDEAFRVLRERAAAAGIDVSDRIEEFVKSVELMVWSGTHFDDQLTQVWADLADLLSRTFVVQPIVEANPRPQFDESDYLRRCNQSDEPGRAVLQLHRSALPGRIRTQSRGDPLRPEEARVSEGDPLSFSHLLKEAAVSSILVLKGRGGSGKTTTMRLLLSEQAKRRGHSPETAVPVLIDLSGYLGNLGALLDRQLQLRNGSWNALPVPLLLLLDGLDIVPRQYLHNLSAELNELSGTGRVSIIISCRPSGPPEILRLQGEITCWSLHPCSLEEVRKIASPHIAAEAMGGFIDEWTTRVQDDDYLALPQGVAACVQSFRTSGSLPQTRRSLLEALLEYRMGLEEERKGSLPDGLADVPHSTVRTIAGSIAFDLWLVGERSRFDLQHRCRSDQRCWA